MGFQIYLTFKGTKHGQLKGESLKGKGGDKWVELNSIKFGARSPVDLATGGSVTGKRKNNPIVITKAQDSSSPLFFSVCCSNEVLTEVILQLHLNGHTLKTVTLKDAHISKFGPATMLPHKPVKGVHYEDIELTFDQIDIENLIDSTSTTDDWTSSGQ